MRYALTDDEWTTIKPMLPNKPRGVPRVNDRRVLNGIFWVLRSGAPWRDLPDNFGPYTTCYNRFVRWRRAGVWTKIMNALAGAHDAAVPRSHPEITKKRSGPRQPAKVIRAGSTTVGRADPEGSVSLLDDPSPDFVLTFIGPPTHPFRFFRGDVPCARSLAPSSRLSFAALRRSRSKRPSR